MYCTLLYLPCLHRIWRVWHEKRLGVPIRRKRNMPDQSKASNGYPSSLWILWGKLQLHSSYAITRPPFVWHIRAGWAFYSEDSSKLPQQRKQVPKCIRPNLTWSDNERGRERTPMAGGRLYRTQTRARRRAPDEERADREMRDKAFPGTE